jgi:hypothetical protein
MKIIYSRNLNTQTKLLIMVISIMTCINCNCDIPSRLPSGKCGTIKNTDGYSISTICIENHTYYIWAHGGIAPKLTNDGKPCPCQTTEQGAKNAH